MKRTVRDLMREIPISPFPAVPPETSISHTVERMSEMQSGAALVVKDGEVKGIFSAQDFLQRSIGRKSMINLGIEVQTVMTRDVIYVTADTSLEECLVLISKARVRHLPVMEGITAIGLLCQGHVTELLVKERQIRGGDLFQYIAPRLVETEEQETKGS